MEQRIRIYGATMIILAAFWTFLILPAYSASTPEKAYYICTGSFKNLSNARHEVVRLLKFKASMKEESVSGATWYRVYIGPYKDKDQARSMARQLQKKKVISAFHILKMEKTAAPSEIVSVTKTAPQKEQKIPAEAAPAEAAPATPGPVMIVPFVSAEEAQRTAPDGTTAAPAQPGEAAAPPPAAEPTAPVPARPPEAPAKVEHAAPQPLTEKPAAGLKQIEPEKAVEHPPIRAAEVPKAKIEKDWFVTAGYSLWYIDMSRNHIGADFGSKGFIHGPTIGFTKGKLGISLSYLSTMGNDLDADVNDTFDSGEAYSRHESMKRHDFDATLRYTFYDVKKMSLSALAGLKYTRLSDMSNTYTRTGGQYTITGDLDIWGPFLGLEILAPLGEPSRTPLFLSLSAAGMFLKGTGNHPQFVPEGGGAYGTTFEGADFSAYGWGAYADAHLIWKVVDGLQLHLGGRFQGAKLTDTSPQGYTMRVSNGYYGGYTSLLYSW